MSADEEENGEIDDEDDGSDATGEDDDDDTITHVRKSVLEALKEKNTPEIKLLKAATPAA